MRCPTCLLYTSTFLPNPGDYSFLYTGDTDNLTTKWWTTAENITENGMYGQKGILHNETIWNAFKGTIWVSVCCALLAGTLGTLIGYAVSKNRRSKWAVSYTHLAELQRPGPGHGGFAQHRAGVARTVDHGPVFAQVEELVRHWGKQAAQAAVLPPAGGAK